MFQDTFFEKPFAKWVNTPRSDNVLTKPPSEDTAFHGPQGAVCSNTSPSLHKHDCSGASSVEGNLGINFWNSKSMMKIIHRENLSWESQKELRKFQKLYPHINPHRDYSQNYNDVLSNLQRSASPYLIQRLQTIEKESSPELHGSDVHFCLTNTTKTIAIF